jgi:hypothetical protein
MNLQEVFDQLSGGEFSQLSIGGAAAGVIDSNNYNNALGHLNLGLTALYTRFSLKEKEVVVPLVGGTNNYTLSPVDLIKIVKVQTETGWELPLNKADSAYSCRTPTLNSIRVPDVILDKVDLPEELVTDSLTVTYRANHPKLELGALSFPEDVVIELPASHLSALLYFVASRVNNPIGMSNEFHAGNSYYAKYEAECQRLELQGMQVEVEQYNDRASRNGWA